MKKVLLTLALVFLGLVFPVLFLMVGSCAAESYGHHVTIKVDTTVVPPAWTVVNPERVDLPDPTHFLVVGEDASPESRDAGSDANVCLSGRVPAGLWPGEPFWLVSHGLQCQPL